MSDEAKDTARMILRATVIFVWEMRYIIAFLVIMKLAAI